MAKVLEDCSGVWVGIWNQFGQRGHMRMTLSFSGGRISGAGDDDTGPFAIFGAYDAADKVDMLKAWATHMFVYDGKWDGAMIHGRSYQIDSPSNFATFEMWPESEELAIEVGREELAAAQ